MLQMAVGQQWR